MACDLPWPGAPPAPPAAAPPGPIVVPAPIDAPAVTPPPAPSVLDDRGDLRARVRAMRAGEVPQLESAFELFEEAEGVVTPDALDGGLLLCDVRVSPASRADSYKGPDLTLLVRAGAMRGHLRGAEDTWAWTMSMPISSLRDADAIWTRVVDRDTWEDETVGERSAALGELPVRMRMRHARVECRGLPRSRIVVRAERAARALDAEVAAVMRRRPDPARAGFGYPSAEVETALGGTQRLAAWVGWNDRLLEERAARLVVWEMGFRQQTREIVAGLARSLPPPGEVTAMRPGLDARVRDRSPGVLRIEVAATSRASPDPAGLVFEVVDDDGTARRAALTQAIGSEWMLATPPGGGTLLRIIESGGSVRWLRIE